MGAVLDQRADGPAAHGGGIVPPPMAEFGKGIAAATA
jgi:hypothetical protein